MFIQSHVTPSLPDFVIGLPEDVQQIQDCFVCVNLDLPNILLTPLTSSEEVSFILWKIQREEF